MCSSDYGKTDWQALDPRVRDVVIDLRYRGDYKPATRQRLQPLLVANNYAGLVKLMADKRYWRQFGVPSDRFKRRKNYLG